MTISINQPAFLPWLGYFNRIALSDFHIVLDHVQFEKNSLTNRNKIRTNEGTLLLTVPLNTSGKFGDLAINKVEIANHLKWQKKIIETIRQFYKKAPFFSDFFPFIEHAILEKKWEKLNDLIKYLNSNFLNRLNIETPIINSSEINTAGAKSDLILNLCKQFKATKYISGVFGRDYLDLERFSEHNIEVVYHEYQHPIYTQRFPDFISHLSIIDLLFNCGSDSKAILMKNNEYDKLVKQ